MVYKCGCGFDAANKREIAAHHLVWHNSEFQEGDPELVQLSKELKETAEVKNFRSFVRGA